MNTQLNREPRGLRCVRNEAEPTMHDVARVVNGVSAAFGEFRQQQSERLAAIEHDVDALNAAAVGGQLGVGGRRRPDALADLLKCDALAALRDGKANTATIPLGASVRDVLAAVTGDGDGAYSAPPSFDPRIAGIGDKSGDLLALLPTIPVASGAFQYNRVTSAYANAAAGQGAQGTTKAEQAVPLSLVTAPIETVAVTCPASEQILADAPALRQQLGRLLLSGVREALEAKLVAGAGSANAITGLTHAGTAYADANATTTPDVVSSAAAALRNLGWRAGGVIMNPSAWHAVRTSKGDDAHYLSGTFDQPAAPSLWSLPVVESPALDANTIVVFDPAQCAFLDRMQVRVDLGRNADDFSRNLMTLRCELRAGLAVFAPSAVAVITLA